MTKLTLTWFGGTLDLAFVQTDNNVSSYAWRNDTARIDMKVAYVTLKAKSASGLPLVRRDISLIHRTYPTPTAFAEQTNVAFSLTTSDDVSDADLEGIISALAGVMTSDPIREQLLAGAPLQN